MKNIGKAKQKKQKGFISLEIMTGIATVALVTVVGVNMMNKYFFNQQIKESVYNIKLIQENNEKTNYEILTEFPQGSVITNNNEYFLQPAKKPLTIVGLNNTYSSTMSGERIGQIISVSDLNTNECIELTNRLAPSFFQTFIATNNASSTTETNLVKLLPKATTENSGRNRVDVPDLVKKCNSIKGNKKVIFHDVMKVDIKLIKALYNADVEKNINELSDKYAEYKNVLKENKDKALKLEKLQQDLIKYRESKF